MHHFPSILTLFSVEQYVKKAHLFYFQRTVCCVVFSWLDGYKCDDMSGGKWRLSNSNNNNPEICSMFVSKGREPQLEQKITKLQNPGVKIEHEIQNGNPDLINRTRTLSCAFMTRKKKKSHKAYDSYS